MKKKNWNVKHSFFFSPYCIVWFLRFLKDFKPSHAMQAYVVHGPRFSTLYWTVCMYVSGCMMVYVFKHNLKWWWTKITGKSRNNWELNKCLRRKCAWDVVYFKINLQPVTQALFLPWVSFSVAHKKWDAERGPF